ncbi:MAG: ABC transporter ATP-binding protein [Clostridiales Family XIII bacterium]|jgi:putative ABC transport system ATP-binding protein|nr:ABC transporter ATP-binding protein [Clostridiales Family XIII bacterium]
MIYTEALRKVYVIGKEKVVALANINLQIAQGEVCCIVGQSGSGKSTLLNMLAGLEKPTRGIVEIAGENITTMSENTLANFRRQNLGFIFQSYNLLPQLTAVENVALPLMISGRPKRERLHRAKKVLSQMGVESRATHKPSEMSGGQQQRVGIARAFVTKPKVIFADEPTGNLDTHTTKQVLMAMLARVKKHGTTFVMVTHEPKLAACGNRIITLLDGKVIENKIQTETEIEENRRILFSETSETGEF